MRPCCAICGAEENLANNRWLTEVLCAECFSEKYVLSAATNRYTLRSRATFYDGLGWVSRSDIRRGRVTKCVGCHQMMLQSDNVGTPVYAYCSTCLGDTGDTIHRYSYKPSPIFHGAPEDGMFMGVELETTSGDIENDNAAATVAALVNGAGDHVYPKRDGTISGVEYVTHPCSLRYHKEVFPWGLMLDIIHDSGARTNHGTGIHIHVSKRALYGKYSRLYRFLNSNKDNVIAIAGRDNSMWAPFCAPEQYLHYRRSRNGINFCNSNTIEFRYFKSSLETNRVFAYLEFVHSVCKYVKGHSSVKWSWYKKYVPESQYPHLHWLMRNVGV